MLTEYKGLVYLGDRVVVPETLRNTTLDTGYTACRTPGHNINEADG